MPQPREAIYIRTHKNFKEDILRLVVIMDSTQADVINQLLAKALGYEGEVLIGLAPAIEKVREERKAQSRKFINETST